MGHVICRTHQLARYSNELEFALNLVLRNMFVFVFVFQEVHEVKFGGVVRAWHMGVIKKREW